MTTQKKDSARREQMRHIMRERKVAYTQVFGKTDPANQAVIADLRRFCREKESTFHPDERIHCLIEGRREVVLRIGDFLDLEVEELCDKYGGDKQ